MRSPVTGRLTRCCIKCKLYNKCKLIFTACKIDDAGL